MQDIHIYTNIYPDEIQRYTDTKGAIGRVAGFHIYTTRRY